MTFATKENAAEAFRMAEHALESDLGEDGGVIRIAVEDLEFIADFLSACVGRLPTAATCEKHNGKNRKRKPRKAKGD